MERIKEGTKTIAIAFSDAPAQYRYWIFYDGNCPTCTNLAHRFRKILNARGFGLAPYQSGWTKGKIPPDHDPAKEMLLKTETGEILGGADALIYLARRIRWAYGLYLMAQVPGIRSLLRTIYRHVATHRHCKKDQKQ